MEMPVVFIAVMVSQVYVAKLIKLYFKDKLFILCQLGLNKAVSPPTPLLGTTHRLTDSVPLRSGLRRCMSHKFSGVADASGPVRTAQVGVGQSEVMRLPRL